MLKSLRALGAAGLIALCALWAAPAFAQAVQVAPGEVCFQATTGINGMIGLLGTLTGGSGGTTGTYTNVAITGGSGTAATATITVSGGAVTQVSILNPGINYVVGDSLSASSADIGNVSGFSVLVSSISINSSLAGGTVGMYVPGTLTYSQTWQNAGQTINNTNPITLDGNGCAIIYGIGTYRQILYDRLGNEVWDQLTSVAPINPFWAGTAGGTANAITLTDASFSGTSGQSIQFIASATNTASATINPSNYGAISVVINTPSGLSALTGGEIVSGNLVTVVYDSVAGDFILTNPAQSRTTRNASGRLTLVSHTPVMAVSETAQTTLYYDAYQGNGVPYYNGTLEALAPIPSNEMSDALQGSGPGVLNDASVFDVWFYYNSGSPVICIATNGSGGGWASDTGGSNTARGTGYSELDNYHHSFVTNANALSYCYNGATNYTPAQYQATYLGTIATDAGTPGSVSFTLGSSASNGGASWIGIWNYYNRVILNTNVVDSSTSYNYASSSVREAHNSATMRITAVWGAAEDGPTFSYASMVFTGATLANAGAVGVCLMDTTGVSGFGGSAGISYTPAAQQMLGSAPGIYKPLPAVGQHFFQACEQAIAGTETFNLSTGSFTQFLQTLSGTWKY